MGTSEPSHADALASSRLPGFERAAPIIELGHSPPGADAPGDRDDQHHAVHEHSEHAGAIAQGNGTNEKNRGQRRREGGCGDAMPREQHPPPCQHRTPPARSMPARRAQSR